MSARLDLATFREKLLRLRAQLVDDSDQMRRDASSDTAHAPIHLADAGTDAHDQEFTLERLGSSSETLQEIDDALDRIEGDSYGLCEECDCDIPERRLTIKPWARLCVGCQEKEEEV